MNKTGFAICIVREGNFAEKLVELTPDDKLKLSENCDYERASVLLAGFRLNIEDFEVME